jgi:hypothetical protein
VPKPLAFNRLPARNGWFPIKRREQMGYGLVGILVIILLIVLIFYFVRRA